MLYSTNLYTYRSNVSSSSWFKSHAIYSNAASVILGHHDKSNARNFCKFSAISSTPSSVTLLHPDNDNTVKCGNECTEIKVLLIKNFSLLLFGIYIVIQSYLDYGTSNRSIITKRNLIKFRNINYCIKAWLIRLLVLKIKIISCNNRDVTVH